MYALVSIGANVIIILVDCHLDSTAAYYCFASRRGLDKIRVSKAVFPEVWKFPNNSVRAEAWRRLTEQLLTAQVLLKVNNW